MRRVDAHESFPGALLSKGELEEVLSIAAGVGAYLFSDEMYRTLEYNANDRLPSAIDCGYANVIVLAGLSKVLKFSTL